MLGLQPYSRISLGVIKHAKKNWLENQLSNHWRNTPKLIHSKKMIELPTTERTRIFLNLNRKQLRILTMLLTGHRKFKYHLFNMGFSDEKICRFCKRAPKIGIHLICHCIKFEYHRVLFYGRSLMLPEDNHNNTFKHKLDLNKASSRNKENRLLINFEEVI